LQPSTDGATVGAFVFSAQTLRTRLIPILNDLKTQHPGFFERHQNSAGGLSIRLDEVLSRYLISAQDTDSVEETLLALVQISVFAKYILYQQFILSFYNDKFLQNYSVRPALPVDAIQAIMDFLIVPVYDLRAELNTNMSLFEDHPADLFYTRICTTVPLNRIHYVEHYFNESVPGSAYANTEQEPVPLKDNALLTVLNVKNSMLFQSKFLQRFEEVLYTDDSNKLASYQHDSNPDHIGTPVAANTPERIVALEAVKRNLLARNSIFAAIHERTQESMRPFRDVIEGKDSDTPPETYSNDSDLSQKRRRFS
jgi:hypothetical protein